MTVLKILIFPDPRLYHVAQPVTEFDAELKKLVDDMAQTMYAAPGIGLAATQVNVKQRVVVLDLSAEHDQLTVLINPEIVTTSGTVEIEEGCLSVPGFASTLDRAEEVVCKAQDIDGDNFTFTANDLLAVCIQHEIDHLAGRLFIDSLSRLKQQRLGKKILKEMQQNDAA